MCVFVWSVFLHFCLLSVLVVRLEMHSITEWWFSKFVLHCVAGIVSFGLVHTFLHLRTGRSYIWDWWACIFIGCGKLYSMIWCRECSFIYCLSMNNSELYAINVDVWRFKILFHVRLFFNLGQPTTTFRGLCTDSDTSCQSIQNWNTPHTQQVDLHCHPSSPAATQMQFWQCIYSLCRGLI